MMLVDAGNTALKWAFRSDGGLAGQGRFFHGGGDLTALAGEAWSTLEAPAAVVVANVAGQTLQESLSRWTQAHWGLQPVFLRATARAAGVTNGYATPGQLGIDRWAAMVAAWQKWQGPVLVIDCGSAVTVDALDGTGRHRGGLIAPGMAMMLHALSRGTADIDILTVQQDTDAPLLADNTTAAVRAGVLRMVTAMIDRVVAEAAGRFGKNLCAVITGGDAPAVLPHLASRCVHEPDLVLKGVAILAEGAT